MDKECSEEISWQDKNLRNSRKLRNLEAIYKTNKPVLSKKYMSLKTRGSEKVPYSERSCSRPIFFNHPIKHSMYQFEQ